MKNRSKNAIQDGMPLKIDFSRFGWILEAKLGCKIHPNRSDLTRHSVARRDGEAWRGVARRGEARRGEAWRGRRERRGQADLASTENRPRGLTQSKGVYCSETPPLRTNMEVSFELPEH